MPTKRRLLQTAPIQRKSLQHVLWAGGRTVCVDYILRCVTVPLLTDKILPGTPLDLSPYDDKAGETEYHASNDFDFQPIDKHEKCPFGAHIRKMRPRGDLNDDHVVIIRRGISYGGDVTPEEQAARKSDDRFERGLMFVCYQSDIRMGFNFLTTRMHPLPPKPKTQNTR